MNNLFLQWKEASDALAITYNLDLNVFLIIYFISIVPIYLGAFLMLYGTTRKLTFLQVRKLQFGNSFSFSSTAKTGLVLHIVGWLLPYSYIFIYGRNLPIWIYVVILFICLCFVWFLFIKITRSRPKFSYESGIEVLPLSVVSDVSEIKRLWGIYDRTFEPINKMSPCRQSLDENHFIDAMKDESVKKYLVYKKDVGSIGLALITKNFGHTPWISAEYFKDKYPQEYEENRIYYFMGLAIDSNFRGNKYSLMLLEKIITDLPRGSILGFDHSRNVNPLLHHFTDIIRKTRVLDRNHIDRQHYHVVHVKS